MSRLSKEGVPEVKRLMTWAHLVIAVACFFIAGRSARAAQPVNLSDPLGFFTNVASRLLRSELGVELNRIQIYPTNQYTPSVHRLLQVTANVYDAATNRPITDYPFVPSIFRPLFTNDGGAIYICGYTEEIGTNLLNATMRDLADSADRAAIQSTDMVYGVAAIVGAKKGWPNFNEFGLQSDVIVSRSLLFHRVGFEINTNQIYRLGISNAFGIEVWNSYSVAFARPLQMLVAADLIISMTNPTGITIGPNGLALSNAISVSVVTNIPGSNWNGFTSPSSNASFIVPLFTNCWFLTNSPYVFYHNAFTNGADPINTFPIPQLWVNLRSRVRFVMVDTDVNRIIDYANLDSFEDQLNLADLLKHTAGGSDATCNGNFNGEIGSLFCTNRPLGLPPVTVPTFGVLYQFGISVGSIQVSDAFWRTYNTELIDRQPAIDAFRNNLFGTGFTPDFTTPFNPQRTIHYGISWQVNDPLVHYQTQDLSDLLSPFQIITFDQGVIQNALSNIGGQRPLNLHYRPWGGSPLKANDTTPPTARRFELKDSQVTRSDSWNFPTNEYPSLDWIGRVHRGTPWQTLFLKATNVDLPTWTNWTGITDPTEAQLTMPTNDWRIVSSLISMLSTNDPHQLYSVNQPNPDAWRGVLDGLTVITNTGPSQFDTLIMSSNSPQAALIANALDASRISQPNRYFHGVGDVLATPELTMASPWLNLTNAQSPITDEAYEKIPAQLLRRLRPDSIGYISQTNGSLSVRFSGIDDYPYGVQVSSNLTDWLIVSTNYPNQGYFDFGQTGLQTFPRQFYRSVLLP